VLSHWGISSKQDLRLVRGTERQELVLREAWVCFHLIHGWSDPRVLEERGQGFDAKIGDTDTFYFSCEFFFASKLNVVRQCGGLQRRARVEECLHAFPCLSKCWTFVGLQCMT
jgi:hypothetical protein